VVDWIEPESLQGRFKYRFADDGRIILVVDDLMEVGLSGVDTSQLELNIRRSGALVVANRRSAKELGTKEYIRTSFYSTFNTHCVLVEPDEGQLIVLTEAIGPNQYVEEAAFAEWAQEVLPANMQVLHLIAEATTNAAMKQIAEQLPLRALKVLALISTALNTAVLIGWLLS
jgi:hypothetical protein